MTRRRLGRREVDDLVRMFERGLSSRDIGRVFGITDRAVRYRLAARQLHYRHVRPRAKKKLAGEMRRGRIHLLRGQGLSFAQMARDLGIGLDWFRAWMKLRMPDIHAQMKAEGRARRMKPPRARPANTFAEWAIARYREGYSIAAIARKAQRHPQSIWRLLRRHRVRLRSRGPRSPAWRRAHGKTCRGGRS